MVLGPAEHGVRDVHTWRSAEGSYWSAYGIPASARYLAWLAEHTGYTLSAIEAEVAAHAAGKAEPGPDEDEQEHDSAGDTGRQDQAETGEGAGEDNSPASTEAG